MASDKHKQTPKSPRDDKFHARRDSRDYLGAEGTVSGQGREGGRLAREIGTRDELKRSRERPGGKTRVRKSNEQEDGST